MTQNPRQRRIANSFNSGKKGVILMAVSLLLTQAAPVFAQTIPADDDVSIKTLAPLENNTPPPPAQTTPSPSSAPRPASSMVRETPPPAMPVAASATTEGSRSTKGAFSNISFTPGDAPAAKPATTATTGSTGTQPAVVETGKVPQSAQPSSMQFSADAPDEQSSKDGQQLAQRPRKNSDPYSSPTAGAAKRPGVLGVVGTVQIRKPFKVFVTEQLIHNLSFRDTPVREVIAEIARRGNLNILIDQSVGGKITGELRDVTLNEAMDSVLAVAGLQHRTLDNSTVIIATMQSIVQLGLNRPMARVFKLSYAHPYDVAMILYASVFNRGMIPDYSNTSQRTRVSDHVSENSSEKTIQGGGAEPEGEAKTMVRIADKEAPTVNDSLRATEINRPDLQRTVRGASQSRTQEGVGFNNAATDPGSQQIRSFQEINTDYIVEQNGGGAIVIPDTKNRQVLVVGTVDDLQVAEEAIQMLDRRPRQVHIQASLIELNNAAVRELGANLNLQGAGLSTSLLGNAAAPLVQFLPGLGSALQNAVSPGGSPPLVPFSTNVAPTNPGTAFTGLVGTLLPAVPLAIAGVQPVAQSQSGFNFLTGGAGTGGKSNIATVPTALNINLNLLLQTNKAKIVANPSVIVVDDTETLITIASEVIHKVTSTVSLGVVTTNVELTKAGVFLNVLPRITEDGFIVMRLRPQVSAPTGPAQTFGSTTAPTTVTLLSVREIMSQEVRVKDGQTLVLGGLFTEQEAAQLAKVPYLAEAPILGALFRNSLKGRDRTELMLLLTPKVVEDDPAAISEAAPTL
jgi:type II secretory pathway component GspD/PulD (secretin)